MINKKWDIILSDELKKPYFKELGAKVKEEYKTKKCFPEYKDIFNALKYTDYDDVRVVILGQDPYHGTGEAHGLSFSVLDGVKRPPSLNNMFKELYSDLGIKREKNDLTDWARQGILMLNSVMTVVKDKPASHKNLGWDMFTDSLISYLNKREDPIVFVLWGNFARSKKILINENKHKIIESVHPSPFSANNGFFGSRPYSKINKYLKEFKKKEINWGDKNETSL